MKKLFFLIFMTLVPMLASAQAVKKVAILEVVDKEGKLSYSQKVLLRTRMAKAITNREGYEAYDRTDVDAIMSEQDFQRSGVVSDAEIRKLGELTGVSYILVTEGILTGENQLFVSAKILNIETAKVEMMDNMIMGLNDEEMQKGCDMLIKRMIGVSANTIAKQKEMRRISNTRAIVASTFIPGLGQMIKGQGGAGAAFLVSEVALFGGGTVSYFLGQKNLKQMQAYGISYDDYLAAQKGKQVSDIAMYTCFGIGAAVHITNMVHAWLCPDKHLQSTVTFAPTIIPTNEFSSPNYAMGVGVQYNF